MNEMVQALRDLMPTQEQQNPQLYRQELTK